MNRQKAAIIGCGFVGSSTAFALMQKGLFSELVLIDADQKKAHGEAADIAHGRPFAHMMQIYAGDYSDVRDCGLIIITAGAAQKPGESRTALVHKNVEIYKTIIPQITAQNFEGILLIVSNPVDILTYAAWKISGYPKERVIGSGTVLDSARFRYLLSEHLQVDSASVHAMIIGAVPTYLEFQFMIFVKFEAIMTMNRRWSRFIAGCVKVHIRSSKKKVLLITVWPWR